MEYGFKELLECLNESVLDDNFLEIAEEVIEELEKMPDALYAIVPILELMENNPDVDYGKPGPLVHFVERFYGHGYEERLIDSLKRKPIKHTVWMLNRIINGSEDKKEYLLGVLDNLISFPDLDTDVVSLAKHFRSLHH
jgi:hypothetical protein